MTLSRVDLADQVRIQSAISKRPDGRFLLTPVNKETGTRIKIYITREDHLKITRGSGFKVSLLDHAGKRWRIYGKPCEASKGCHCDAWAVPVKMGNPHA